MARKPVEYTCDRCKNSFDPTGDADCEIARHDCEGGNGVPVTIRSSDGTMRRGWGLKDLCSKCVGAIREFVGIIEDTGSRFGGPIGPGAVDLISIVNSVMPSPMPKVGELETGAYGSVVSHIYTCPSCQNPCHRGVPVRRWCLTHDCHCEYCTKLNRGLETGVSS